MAKWVHVVLLAAACAALSVAAAGDAPKKGDADAAVREEAAASAARVREREDARVAERTAKEEHMNAHAAVPPSRTPPKQSGAALMREREGNGKDESDGGSAEADADGEGESEMGGGVIVEGEKGEEQEAAGEDAGERLERAFTLLEAGGADVAKGVAALEMLVDEGNAEAMFQLGVMLLYGAHVPRDEPRAVALFERSAAMGNDGGQSGLAFLYASGLGGVERDAAKSLLYYYFAALAGNTAAEMALGYRHMFGIDTPRSCETAVVYYKNAAEKVVSDTEANMHSLMVERIRLSDEEEMNAITSHSDEEILDYHEYAAAKGSMDSQVVLGQLHMYGSRGIPQDYAAAREHFEAAAAQGDHAAGSHLARMYMHGMGIPQNNETALKLYREGADAGYPPALNGLAYMHLHGHGVRRDTDKAYKYFQRAAKKQYPEAQYNLGKIYVDGVGRKRDYKKAIEYFSMAGAQGHVLALYELAMLHFQGKGTVRSCPAALNLLKEVAERGPWALELDSALDTYLEGDVDGALMRYAQLAEEGHEVAQLNAAWLLDHEWEALDSAAEATKFRYFEHAATQGNVEAELKLGDMNFYGFGDVDANLERAAKHYLRATERPSAQWNALAFFNLGYMHEWGLGLSQDFPLAKRYFDMAATVNPSARVPVLIALLNMRLHEWGGEYYLHAVANAENIAIAVLAVLLAAILAARRGGAQEQQAGAQGGGEAQQGQQQGQQGQGEGAGEN